MANFSNLNYYLTYTRNNFKNNLMKILNSLIKELFYLVE